MSNSCPETTSGTHSAAARRLWTPVRRAIILVPLIRFARKRCVAGVEPFASPKNQMSDRKRCLTTFSLRYPLHMVLPAIGFTPMSLESSFSPRPGRRSKNQPPSEGSPVSRRNWMATAACHLPGLSSAAGLIRVGDSVAAEQATSAKRKDYIDAHVHVWTPDANAYPLKAGFRRDQMKPRSFTPEELFSHARPSGVARIVLIQMSFYGFDNRYMTDMMKQHPGSFSGVAVIDDEAPGVQDEMRRLKELGVRGFRIYPRDRPIDRWLDTPGMAAMCAMP